VGVVGVGFVLVGVVVVGVVVGGGGGFFDPIDEAERAPGFPQRNDRDHWQQRADGRLHESIDATWTRPDPAGWGDLHPDARV
jgi:hypothetical protein